MSLPLTTFSKENAAEILADKLWDETEIPTFAKKIITACDEEDRLDELKMLIQEISTKID